MIFDFPISIFGTSLIQALYNGRLCVCVCVFFPSILDIKFVGRTSRGHTGGRSHRIFNPPSFCGACLDFCREKEIFNIYIELGRESESKRHLFKINLFCTLINTW